MLSIPANTGQNQWKGLKLVPFGTGTAIPDEQNASAFLPFKVRMKKQEHIAAYFEPFGVNSLLAGIGPADGARRAGLNIIARRIEEDGFGVQTSV